MFKGLLQGPNHTEPWPWLQIDDVIEDWDNLLSDFKTYSRPMLEFVGSNSEPRTLRSTDYLKISS